MNLTEMPHFDHTHFTQMYSYSFPEEMTVQDLTYWKTVHFNLVREYEHVISMRYTCTF